MKGNTHRKRFMSYSSAQRAVKHAAVSYSRGPQTETDGLSKVLTVLQVVSNDSLNRA
jgi:hypothetical protein